MNNLSKLFEKIILGFEKIILGKEYNNIHFNELCNLLKHLGFEERIEDALHIFFQDKHKRNH
jgi:hypothetical protein